MTEEQAFRPTPRAPTIYDVAKAAGVAASTVSRTFSRPGRVNADTAERIRLAAADLGYRTNPLARALPTGRTSMVAVMISDITNPFYFDIIRGAQAAVAEAGYTMLLADAQESDVLEREALEVREEIIRCRDLLIQLTGSPGPFFRTSSGQHASALILAEAGAAGYPVTLSYDVDPQDWTDPSAAAVREGAAQAAGGSIVSLHFGHPGTVEALPGILDDLQARGLQAVSASTLLAG